jgi:hypothetical protein
VSDLASASLLIQILQTQSTLNISNKTFKPDMPSSTVKTKATTPPKCTLIMELDLAPVTVEKAITQLEGCTTSLYACSQQCIKKCYYLSKAALQEIKTIKKANNLW